MKFYQRLSFIFFSFWCWIVIVHCNFRCWQGKETDGGTQVAERKMWSSGDFDLSDDVIDVDAYCLWWTIEHDTCKSSSWGAQRININIFDPCVWRVLADCCYPEKMRRGWTLAWAPTQLLQVEIQARPVSIVNCQISETSYCSSSGSSTTNLTSNFPNPANIDIIINTCEVKRSHYMFLWVFDNPSAIDVIVNAIFAGAINFWVMILIVLALILSELVNDVFLSIPKKCHAFRRHQFGPGVVNIYRYCCNIPIAKLDCCR